MSRPNNYDGDFPTIQEEARYRLSLKKKLKAKGIVFDKESLTSVLIKLVEGEKKWWFHTS